MANLVGDSGIGGIFVHDRRGVTSRASVANDDSQPDRNDFHVPDISADGRYVVFPSGASNLVFGDSNGFTDVFVRDRKAGTTERVSVASDGTQANGASFRSNITRH